MKNNLKNINFYSEKNVNKDENMAVIILDYQKSHYDENGKRISVKSLVQCETCLQERLVFKQSVKRSNAANICNFCSKSKINKGKPAWNKGKKCSQETKDKISKNNARPNLGKKASPETTAKRLGPNHPLWIEDREQKKINDKIYYACRKLIRRSISNKKDKTKDLLGYSHLELKTHLESTWTEKMNWENYGYFGWHIDHIIPVKFFIDSKITDPKIINSLINLRALDYSENFAKHDQLPEKNLLTETKIKIEKLFEIILNNELFSCYKTRLEEFEKQT